MPLAEKPLLGPATIQAAKKFVSSVNVLLEVELPPWAFSQSRRTCIILPPSSSITRSLPDTLSPSAASFPEYRLWKIHLDVSQRGLRWYLLSRPFESGPIATGSRGCAHAKASYAILSSQRKVVHSPASPLYRLAEDLGTRRWLVPRAKLPRRPSLQDLI
jgi:hypothetical protein